MAFTSNNNANLSGNIDDQSNRRGNRNEGLDSLGGHGGLNDRSGLGDDGCPRTGGGGGGISSGGVNDYDQGRDGRGAYGNDNLGGRGGQHETFGGVGDGNHSGLPGSHGYGDTTHGGQNPSGKTSMSDKIGGTYEQIKGKVTKDPSLQQHGELRKQEMPGSYGRQDHETLGISESPSSTMPGAFNANSHPVHGATHTTTKPSMGEKVMEKLTGKDAYAGQHQDVYGGVGENRSGLAATHNTHGHDTRQHNPLGATNTAGHPTLIEKTKDLLPGNDGHSGHYQQNLGGVGDDRSGLAGTHNTHGHETRQHGTHGATNTSGHPTLIEKTKDLLPGNDGHSGQHQHNVGGVGDNRSGLAGTHNTHGHDTRQHNTLGATNTAGHPTLIEKTKDLLPGNDGHSGQHQHVGNNRSGLAGTHVAHGHDTRQHGAHGATNTSGHPTMMDKAKDLLPGNDGHSGQHQHNVGGVGDNKSSLTGAHNTHGNAPLAHSAHGATNPAGKASIVDKVKGTLEELTGKVTGNPVMQHQGEQRKAGELSGAKPAGVGGVGY